MATSFGRQAGGRQAGVQDAAGPAAGATFGTVDLANGYAQRAAIDAATVETLRQANGAFLALVARRAAADDGAHALGLPREVAARIATQDATTRRFASECPYTLFNVRFEDAAFWRGAAATAASATSAAGPAIAAGATGAANAAKAGGAEPRSAPWAAGDEPRFVLTAVFLAWHLARHEDLSSALVLGMTPSVRDVWRGLPLQVLEALALASLPHLRARWGTHPRFWPQLLDAAERPGLDHADRVRLLGLQLLATDGCRTSLPHRSRRPA
jgi:hypothetical protein